MNRILFIQIFTCYIMMYRFLTSYTLVILLTVLSHLIIINVMFRPDVRDEKECFELRCNVAVQHHGRHMTSLCHCVTWSHWIGPRFFLYFNRALLWNISGNVVYRVPITGTRSRGIAHRQSLWLADMWHAWFNENGVDIQAISSLVIGFPLFGTISLFMG